jgi:hypothetical protein
MYEIITRNPNNPPGYRDWTTDAIGQPNEFVTREEAEEAIESLKALGDDWAEAEYRVREVA